MDPELQKIFSAAFQDELEKCALGPLAAGALAVGKSMLPWIGLDLGMKGLGTMKRGLQGFGRRLAGGGSAFSPHKVTA